MQKWLPQIRADRQEASQREARVSVSKPSIAHVHCPHIKTWSVHCVRRKWDDHETRPLARATFILTLPHSHIDVGPREQAKLLFLVKHRTTMSLVHHTVACAQFSYWANWWVWGHCSAYVHGSLFAYAQHKRQLRSGANLKRFEDIGVDLNTGVRQKLYCMQSVYLNVILHSTYLPFPAAGMRLIKSPLCSRLCSNYRKKEAVIYI